MSNIPSDLRYTTEHEWVRLEGDEAVAGITDYAQSELGDVVYVEVFEPGTPLTQFKPFGVVESVKAASDLFSPLSGEVLAFNQALEDTPELVNDDPYGEGWMMRFKPSDLAELDNLLTAEGYEKMLAG
ncbi:MAG: glycine cleavage system protein GcvH [Chloroflexi bacterium]|nr:glycine cleavage system protein GcvH [Chloroflexota bacterium]